MMTYHQMGRAVVLCALQLLTMGTLSTVHSAPVNLAIPQLSITSTQGAMLLSWPEWATNWVLEESAQLPGPAQWAPVSAGTSSARISPSPVTNGFFRLRRLSPVVTGLTGHWRFDQGGGEATDGPVVVFTNASWALGRVGAQSLRFNRSVALHAPGPGTNRIVFASSALNVSARALLLPGQWYELTVTYDGARGSVYLDGNLLASETGSVTTDERPIYFGAGVGGYNSFPGRIDEVRIYRTALTAEQVSLTGHWSFDEGAGRMVYDSSVGGNHGHAAADSACAAGKSGTAMRVGSSNEITIPNEQFTVLPPAGGPFSLSFWVCPHSLPVGHSGLMSLDDGINSAWELAIEVDDLRRSTIRFASGARQAQATSMA